MWAVKLADRITNLGPPPSHWRADKVDAYRDEAPLAFSRVSAPPIRPWCHGRKHIVRAARMGGCAEASGKYELVERVAATNDYAYIEQLKDDPELRAWLTDNGITLVEAARIQPNYGGDKSGFGGEKPRDPPPPPGVQFDRAAAADALAKACMAAAPCHDGAPLITHHAIVFALDGHVVEVKSDQGPPAIATCVASEYEKVKIPSFGGTPVTVGKTCALGKPPKR